MRTNVVAIQELSLVPFCRETPASAMPRATLCGSWLRQVEAYLKDMGMTGPASAWGWTDGGLNTSAEQKAKIYKAEKNWKRRSSI